MATQVSAVPSGGLRRVLLSNDGVMAVAVMTVLMSLFVPLPPLVLDIFITLNIGLTVTALLVAMYLGDPTEFTAFPSLILILTVFRLGISVAATRSILLHGFAGDVIQAFGQFVVGGNLVIGLVIFLVIMIIQFMVITKGAERVAEVRARFTLDGMPGKQMSVDSELAAGHITEQQARARKQAIEQEADFYGSMDGASKFVRGDAIAALIMVSINMIGGLVVGMIQNGLSFQDALNTYSLLSVGDGLVSQVPALLISAATGIIVTRSGSTRIGLGGDIVSQLFGNTRALTVAGSLLAVLGLVPGLPKIPFFVLAISAVVLSRTLDRRRQDQLAAAETHPALPSPEGPATEDVSSFLTVEAMALEIGHALIPLVDTEQGGSLLARIAVVRGEMARSLGIIIPTINVRDNLALEPTAYRFILRGTALGQGEVQPRKFLAMNTGLTAAELPGTIVREPAFGLEAVWIAPDERQRAEILGYAVIDPETVVVTHITELLKRYAPQILDRKQAAQLIERLREDNAGLVDEVVPALLPLSEVQRVLAALLSEGISIRDLASILEAIGSAARTSTSLDHLVEAVRRSLARAIVQQCLDADECLHVITFAPGFEALLINYQQRTEDGPSLVMPPPVLDGFLTALKTQMEEVVSRGYPPKILCSHMLRWSLRQQLDLSLPKILSEGATPPVIILSYREVPPEVRVVQEGNIDVQIALPTAM